MICTLSRVTGRVGKSSNISSQHVRFAHTPMYAPDVETEEWGLFPREREGNIYVHNWSEDGVVPTKGLFHNTRMQVLTNAIHAKAPAYFGKYALLESGLGLTHEHFSEIFHFHQENISLESIGYAEDAVVAHCDVRNGVRVATKIPGQRPIVAFVSGDHDILAVQFVETNNEIVGANVVAGAQVPVCGTTEGMGHAATVLVNEQHASVVALRSTVLANDKNTLVQSKKTLIPVHTLAAQRRCFTTLASGTGSSHSNFRFNQSYQRVAELLRQWKPLLPAHEVAAAEDALVTMLKEHRKISSADTTTPCGEIQILRKRVDDLEGKLESFLSNRKIVLIKQMAHALQHALYECFPGTVVSERPHAIAFYSLRNFVQGNGTEKDKLELSRIEATIKHHGLQMIDFDTAMRDMCALGPAASQSHPITAHIEDVEAIPFTTLTEIIDSAPIEEGLRDVVKKILPLWVHFLRKDNPSVQASCDEGAM